jgi:hypothetical protein
MKNIKLLRMWYDGTITAVRVGLDVKLCNLVVNADENDNRYYIIDEIDTERLEVTLRLNSLGTDQIYVVGRNELSNEYAFFGQI